MIQYMGNGNFDQKFDYYTWSAPFFDTPREVVRYICEMNLSGKVLRRINMIGCGDNAGYTDTGLLYQKLREAGLEPEYNENDDHWNNWYCNYPDKEKILVPCCVHLCEPIQFIFEDGTTLEILPTESGGARIGVNSIPADISDGLNRSNFNGNVFFKEILGRKFESFSLSVTETKKQYVNENSLNCEFPYTETRHKYHFQISFGYPYEIALIQTLESWYCVELLENLRAMNVPYSRIQASRKAFETKQIMIVNGRGGGGTFWILPINLDRTEEESDWLMDGYGISIDDIYVAEFLSEFLYRYFDPDIQEREEYEENSFDWYGGNLYSFDSIKKMVEDIRTVCRMLENDYSNPALTDIKSQWSWYPYSDKRVDELSKKEIDSLRKHVVPVALDFYNRFCDRMENMMQIPGVNAISFAGP